MCETFVAVTATGAPEAESELRGFVAARAWASTEGARALFDRAVLWLVDARVLLPGITTLARLVAEVRAAEAERLYETLAGAVSAPLRRRLEVLVEVVEGSRSSLETLRNGPRRVSGAELVRALERAGTIRQSGRAR